MQLSEIEISEVVTNVWVISLGSTLEPSTTNAGTDGTLCIGRVGIQGRWNGTVELVLPESSARRAAALMYEEAASEVTADQLRDAVGELTNMIAGNIKSQLPAPNVLLLPQVAVESSFSGEGAVRIVQFEWGGQPVAVMLRHG